MEDLVERIERTILSYRLLEPEQGSIVAVSGGLDSMALLDLLYQLSQKYGWKLIVAHFNHRLRGVDSDKDEQLVAETAKQLGLPFVRGEADVRRQAARERISVEMAARQLRHAFLAQAAREQGVDRVALAHQADDQVETFFLRLLRGAGGEGLAGMRYHSPSPADRKIILIRPLLDIRRAELIAYARERGLRWREDRSNQDRYILRNKIRHELIPFLEQQFQPALHRVIRRVAELLGAESDCVGNLARRYLNEGRSDFESLHPAVQRRVIYEQLLRLTLEPAYDIVEELRLRPRRPVMIRAGLNVWRDETGRIHQQGVSMLRFYDDRVRLFLHGDHGQIDFGGLRIRWRIRRIRELRCLPPRRPGKEWFDADLVGTEVLLRHWQPGDRFQLIGMPTAAKLQDLFTNVKIPAQRRRELVLAARSDGQLFWVEGLRIGEIARLREETRRVLIWEWESRRSEDSKPPALTPSAESDHPA